METMDARSRLARAAMEFAVAGAREYADRNGIFLDLDALSDRLAQHLRATMRGALDDARDAIDAGMVQVAEQTFAASMALAGIAAAKELEDWREAELEKMTDDDYIEE